MELFGNNMDRLIDVIIAFGKELQVHVASTNTCSPALTIMLYMSMTCKVHNINDVHTFLDQLLKFSP